MRNNVAPLTQDRIIVKITGALVAGHSGKNDKVTVIQGYILCILIIFLSL